MLRWRVCQQDVQQIIAIRDYIEDGMPSSKAAKLVQHQLPKTKKASQPNSLEAFTESLTQAFLDLDEAKANKILSEAHALHRGIDVFLHIMLKSVLNLGELWHAGEIDIATEHFASNYVQARLRSLLNSQPEHAGKKTIVVACAPHEQHELGALMLAVMLRQAAYRIIYLGANTPIKDLSILSSRLKPSAILISISTQPALKALLKESTLLGKLAPLVALGGSAISSPDFKAPSGTVLLTGTLEQSVEQIHRFVLNQENKMNS